MSTDENKEIVMRSVEVFFPENRARIDALIDEIYAPDWVLHDPGMPTIGQGSEALKQFMHQLLENIPDFYQVIDDMVAEGDKVASRISMGGTEAATGKQVKMQLLGICRIAGGKIAEEWNLEVTLPLPVEA